MIVHRTGSAWQQVASGTTADLAGVWGSGSDDIWVVGYDGTVLHYDGSAFQPLGVSPNGHPLVYGTGPDDVWISNDDSTVLHYDGLTFAETDSTARPWINSMWSSGPGDVWAVGAGTFVYYDDQTWTPAMAKLPVSGVVWGSSPCDVWAIGGQILHYDGQAWSLVGKTPDPWTAYNYPTYDIWGTGANNIYASGTHVLLHYDGQSWQLVPDVPAFNFGYSVWGSGASDVYLLSTEFGQEGNLFHHQSRLAQT